MTDDIHTVDPQPEMTQVVPGDALTFKRGSAIEPMTELKVTAPLILSNEISFRDVTEL